MKIFCVDSKNTKYLLGEANDLNEAVKILEADCSKKFISPSEFLLSQQYNVLAFTNHNNQIIYTIEN